MSLLTRLDTCRLEPFTTKHEARGQCELAVASALYQLGDAVEVRRNPKFT